MTDLTELTLALDALAHSTGFRLDNRSDEAILSAIYDYAALIPFDDDHSWADLLFMKGNTPKKLAELYRDSRLADGMLPPQQAFLLAMLKLLETPRALLNHFPAAHRELYYRGLLGLRERSAKADRVALSFKLKPTFTEHFIAAGALFDAGQDSNGASIHYALDRSLLVNRGEVTDLRWVRQDDARTHRMAVPYDVQNQLAWPDQGLTLFDASKESGAVVTGRMVASALLAMPAGLRTITLTFAENVKGEEVTLAQVSSAKGWLDLTPLDSSSTATTQLTFTLPASADAIAAPGRPHTTVAAYPLLKVGCRNGTVLPAIKQLTVSALGNNAVRYSTDAGVDRVADASYPFGTLPKVGSGFNLMSSEWCKTKASIDLTLIPRWVDVPKEGFASLYSGYDRPPDNNAAFQVQCRLMYASGSKPPLVLNQPLPLFGSGTGLPEPAALKVTLPPLLASQIDPANPRDWPQWLRVELVGRDFGHEAYFKLAERNGVNPPYTPRMESLTVLASASVPASDFTQYMLTPFGYGPQEVPANVTNKAELYVGLTGSLPGESLSLYWQLQSPQAMNPSWQYLNQHNRWADLNETVVDGTNGLFESGLWSAVLPTDAADHAPQMPEGRYWLRAQMTLPEGGANPAWCPRLSGLDANSATATLNAPEAVETGHFRQPLSAGTITRSVTPIAALEKVKQRWPSMDGQPAETSQQFYRRAAQRLSHRERAHTWQNMASLLKERYPRVFNVVLPPADVMTRLPAPVEQKLLVIPVNAKKDNQDALRPMFSNAHLTDMAAYLQTLASPWMSIVLANPTYRDVGIEYDVTFNVNPQYGYRKLRELITLRYMPWAHGGEDGAVTGNTLDYYGIIAWIQRQSFVEQVNSMTLDGSNMTIHGAEDEVLVLAWTVAKSNTPTEIQA